MGPFRRTRNSLDAAGAASAGRRVDWRVERHEFHRLGQALATLVVEVKPAPRTAEARLRVTAEGSIQNLAPMLATNEAPGTGDASHRLWFVVDLSQVMFGDSTFALLIGDDTVELPQPTARAAWDDEEPALSSAWSRSELEAAVHALEARCRSAERLAAATVEDADEVARREVAALQELLEMRESAYRAVKDVVDTTAADRDARQAEVDALRTNERHVTQVVSATIADVQAERETLLAALRDAERDKQELRAALSAQADELALAKAALKQHHDRFGARAPDAAASAG